jgi:DNA end-binding protein Ku
MAPRAYWKGSLKLSLVSCPVALYPATTSAEKTHFQMINKETGNRLKQQMVDAETGDVVEGDQKARGYELRKGEYVEVEKGRAGRRPDRKQPHHRHRQFCA